MKRLSFRTRVLLNLVLFAVIPSTVLLLGGAVLVGSTLPVLSGGKAWDSVAATGRRAIDAAREAPLTPAQRGALDAHERELAASLVQAKRYDYLASRAVVLVGLIAVVGSLLVALLASRVAGHLSRQLSRPLNEVVEWAERIARGEALPAGPPRRGAPEFEALRQRMRAMAAALATARERDREASRLEAFRETARRVAHELKNPLTPIRLAVARLARIDDPRLGEPVEVLETETRRLEEMARSFAQFGRLPEGPMAEVDLGEMARYASRAIALDDVPVHVEVDPDVPLVDGHYDALARALSNVVLNAVEACRGAGGGTGGKGTGEVAVHVRRTMRDGREMAELCVRDTGSGIAPERLASIWEPYVTSRAGGTGLGLAITRQTILAHGGVVDARSRVGEGTEIRLAIPARGNGTTAREEGAS